MMLTTTLKRLIEFQACNSGMYKLKTSLSLPLDGNAPISLLHILEVNGLLDTLWALRAVQPDQQVQRLWVTQNFIIKCAEHVLPLYRKAYPDDKRLQVALAKANKVLECTALPTSLVSYQSDAYEAYSEAHTQPACMVAYSIYMAIVSVYGGHYHFVSDIAGTARKAVQATTGTTDELYWQINCLKELLR